MSATNFKPAGNCVLANVATSAASVFVTSTAPVGAWLVTNAGTQDVFFRLSTNGAAVAAVPTTSGTSAPGQMINAGDTYIVSLPLADAGGANSFVSNVTISAMTQSGTSQLFINPVQPF
jgi:hypothetical protein